MSLDVGEDGAVAGGRAAGPAECRKFAIVRAPGVAPPRTLLL